MVLTDLRMEKVDGMQILRRCRESHPDTEVILITGYATLESAVEAMKHGAFYYIAKPYRLDEVRKVVAEALEKIRLKRENRSLREQVESYQGKVRILTQDHHMQHLLDMARQVAPTDCYILITANPHRQGAVRPLPAPPLTARVRPLVAVICAHSTGAAATSCRSRQGRLYGATPTSRGCLEAASGGTLFST